MLQVTITDSFTYNGKLTKVDSFASDDTYSIHDSLNSDCYFFICYGSLIVRDTNLNVDSFVRSVTSPSI